MPRLFYQTPRYRKHRASGQAIVELNGRVHYLGPHGPHGTQASKREYDRLIMEWLANGRRLAAPTPSSPPSVAELCQRYRKFAESYYVKDGKPTCLAAVKVAVRMVRIHYGKTAAVEFGPIALKAIRQRLVENNLSRRYVNDQIDRIRRMFKWAVAEQLLPVEVYQALAVVSGLRKGRSEARETDPVLPVDDATVEATLPHLPPVVADMVRLQRLTGCRPAELCLIRPADIDRSGQVWQYIPRRHKTEHKGRRRTVLIGPQAQEILLRYLARDPETYCFRPVDSEAKRRAAQHAARVTPLGYGNRPGTNRKARPNNQPGECYTACSYRHAIHRACDKAFPPPPEVDARATVVARWRSEHRWSPNRLRHAAATEIRRQFGLEAAQILLGHATANVTEIYAERDLAKGLEVARLIG